MCRREPARAALRSYRTCDSPLSVFQTWICSALYDRALVSIRGAVPVDVLHPGIDIRRRLRAVVDVIRVLVHVERENNRAVAERGRMVGRPLIDELCAARR